MSYKEEDMIQYELPQLIHNEKISLQIIRHKTPFRQEQIVKREVVLRREEKGELRPNQNGWFSNCFSFYNVFPFGNIFSWCCLIVCKPFLFNCLPFYNMFYFNYIFSCFLLLLKKINVSPIHYPSTIYSLYTIFCSLFVCWQGC